MLTPHVSHLHGVLPISLECLPSQGLSLSLQEAAAVAVPELNSAAIPPVIISRWPRQNLESGMGIRNSIAATLQQQPCSAEGAQLNNSIAAGYLANKRTI